jgi:purine-binding chemotaxis protein CheW
MTSAAGKKKPDLTHVESDTAIKGFVTIRVGGQLFGVSVLMVQDVLRQQPIARIPLAPVEIAGSLNLRGRIVTVVDMRVRMEMPSREEEEERMHVVVEHRDELFSLMVDSVGDVLNIPVRYIEKSPANLERNWRELAHGVSKLDKELLVILDVQSLLTF